jgi:hypothetical protein
MMEDDKGTPVKYATLVFCEEFNWAGKVRRAESKGEMEEGRRKMEEGRR